MSSFIPALELNAVFYQDVVAPLLSRWSHSAARIGAGSEVLGFDSPRSTDHGWGPQLVVFVAEENVAEAGRVVDVGLPETFRGWPVRYGWDDTPVGHHVTVTTMADWFSEQLGVDPSAGLSAVDWLVVPQQKLVEVTSGAVYRDDGGMLAHVQGSLEWYPEQVGLWILACQWRRIAQEEAFVGRTAEAGDSLGSTLVSSRLARELMRLWFLLNRSYWPYMKWFGSAFARLPGSRPLADALEAAIAADDMASREEALAAAYRLVADRHNDTGLSDPVDPAVRTFHERPYRVLMADRFVDACLARVDDPVLRQLPLVGSVDQLADSTDLLSYPDRARRLLALYQSGGD
ncbi:MAG: DUF4037 domain-containing protein [Acidimicrobiaceae bacterium]|nr:DUF4037 domain-containing protein [Acidimicrobiaceae bacterium]